MAGNVIEVVVRTNDQTREGMDSAGRNAMTLKQRLGDVAGTAAGMLAANAIGAGVSGFKNLVGGAIESASDLNESVNAVQMIFGKSAGTILDWGKQNAVSFGLSQQAFNEMATPMGAMLKNAGLSMQDTSKWTIDLTKRASDMASVFNTSVPDALEAIQAGLRGEQDPLERYGVSLSAAKVEAEALAETHKKSAKELTDTEKATARLNLIMKQTSATQGDFQNTSDGLANSQRIQDAKMKDLQATIGQKLLPAKLALTRAEAALAEVLATKVIPVFEAVTGFLQRNPDLVRVLAVVVGVALTAAFYAWATAAWAAAAAVIAANAPIIAITAAIAAVIAALVLAYTHLGWFKTGVDTTFKVASAIFSAFGALVGVTVGLIRNHWQLILNILLLPVRAAMAVITFLFVEIPKTVLSAVTSSGSIWDRMKNIILLPVQIAIKAVVFLFYGLPKQILSSLPGMSTLLDGKGKDLINGLLNGAKNALEQLGSWASSIKDAVVSKIKGVFGINSPSTVFAALGGHMIDGLFQGLSKADPMAFVKNIFGDVNSALGAMVSKSFIAIKDLPAKAWGVLGSLGGKIGGALSGMFGGGGGGGAGVEKWRGVALQALAYTGSPSSWIGSLLRRMNQESGGNQFAINNWDINAKRGDPSRGLMQTIGSTFRAYARELAGRGIYDPFANIVASIRYANAAYGSAPRGWNRPGGYDKGGWLLPGTTLMTNLTGKPEMVLTQDQIDSIGGGRMVLEINSGGSRLDDLLLEILRGAIRVRGGDVQLVLGRG